MGVHNVAIADDNHVIRRYVRALLEDEPDLTVVGEAGSGQEAISLTENLRPEVLILDLSLGDINGMEVARRLLVNSPGTNVVIYSFYDADADMIKAQQLGVKGYVSKRADPCKLVKAVREVAEGGQFFNHSRPCGS